MQSIYIAHLAQQKQQEGGLKEERQLDLEVRAVSRKFRNTAKALAGSNSAHTGTWKHFDTIHIASTTSALSIPVTVEMALEFRTAQIDRMCAFITRKLKALRVARAGAVGV